ncbi:amino acid permease [Mycobacterium lepromatosis]|nr:amino acid permease [Mycobacterium lepromatosis]
MAIAAIGWSGYVNKLLRNLFGFEMLQALSAVSWNSAQGYVNLPVFILIGMCGLF